jgi:hypothetical protein
MMPYEIDQDTQKKRYFSAQVKYSDIDWLILDEILDAYRERIKNWYLDPAKELAKNPHFAFSVMALCCLLIDTLSQFVAGADSSSGQKFKEFIRTRLPATYSRKLKTPIEHYDGSKRKKNQAAPDYILEYMSDVLWHGFRCGILHQAHIPPYGGVAPGTSDAAREISGAAKYKASGADCAGIIVNPFKLLEDLEEAFDAYFRELKDRDQKQDQLRENFKKKFSTSFGVDISTAS